LTRGVTQIVCHDFGMRALAIVFALVGLCAFSHSASAQVFKPRGKVVSMKPNTTKAAPVGTLATTTVAQQEALAKGADPGTTGSKPVKPAKDAKQTRVAAVPAKKQTPKPSHKAKSKPKHGGGDDVIVVDDDDDDDVKIDDE
jgi:hypothetical protein